MLSYASWLFSAYIWIHPESLAPILSEWSQLMLIGPDSARFTSASANGRRLEAAMYKFFPHIGKTAGRCCCQCSCSCCGSSDCSTHRTVLTLYRNKLCIYLSICYERSKILRNLCRRCDWKCRKYIRINLSEARLLPLHYLTNDLFFPSYFTPSIVIAPNGHAFTQIPHPLQ